ncbi:WXG100 family type VII secretion target [Rhodococcus aetherivorans]|uniref:WXG100 family type VII secretion target n=1 Tax=Rhodococcus aetherivorans TaxID=191292 RepID=A0AA46PIK6_9NOCA|nr:WXG100 family type VII secretion target [Rhodococcus aetherivorans]UYF94959.1 WXG100 family type VII secretion target [Rhodococcus aetherivorans]
MPENENPVAAMLEPLLEHRVPERVGALADWHTRLVARLEGSFDPDYATAFENFHSMEHDAIYRDVQRMDPGAMRSLAESWRKIATDMSVGFIFGTQMICNKIAEGWDGDAARRAVAATRSFARSTEQLVTALLAVSTKLAAASEVASAVRNNVPPPPAQIPMPLGVVVPQDTAEFARAAEAAHAEAVRVMESLYVPHYRESGTAVPVLPSPHEATAGSGPVGADLSRHPSGSAEGRGGGTGPSASAAGTGPSASAAGADDGQVTDAPSRGTSATDGEADPGGPAPGAGEPAATTPAATTTAGATSGPERYPGSGGPPGGPGGPTSGGAGGGSGGSGAAGPGGLGPVGGLPVANGTTNPATSGAGARAGSARPGGMYPGMLGAPARPARDDEAARTVPSYLVGADNGNELVGPMPLTAPPVLGVDPA